MRLFDSIRGHFALFTGREISTVAGKASFIIERVHSRDNPASGWIMDIKVVSSGEIYPIYISDIINVYVGILNNYWNESGTQWVTLVDLSKLLHKHVDEFKSSYIMALLATFDDIESRSTPNSAIRYMPFNEHFSKTMLQNKV